MEERSFCVAGICFAYPKDTVLKSNVTSIVQLQERLNSRLEGDSLKCHISGGFLLHEGEGIENKSITSK